MIKLLLIIISLATLISASSKETCYTVQLVSKFASQKNINLLNEKSYPSSCKVMQIGKTLTVRCGCYEKIASANDSLFELKKEYSRAVVSTTYKHRFDAKDIEVEPTLVEKVILSSVEKEERKNPPVEVFEEEFQEEYEEEIVVQSSENNEKEVCYTVQLVSRFNSQKNRDILKENSYPQSCKTMEIASSLTVRCGCYDKQADSRESLKKFKLDYKNATIARSYKYRFTNPNIDTSVQSVDVKPTYIKKRVITQDEQELRLILQVFLYKTDLENAFKVASLGYKKNPDSYYWNQKMAEISSWTNRSARSMKHLRFMYEDRFDAKIEQKLIDYGSASYQYEEIEPLVVNRAKRNPSEKNIDLMILVYRKTGAPEKVIDVLDSEYEKNPQNRMLLTKALELSLEIGDLGLSKKYVTMIEESQPYSKKDASLIARYYYITQDIPKAYNSLLFTKKVSSEEQTDYIKFYQLKSDLGWYLQDNENAAEASKVLMDIDKARLVDYERISFVYQKKDPKIASEAFKRGYKEYQHSYLFYSYANEAINSENFDELRELLESIDEENSPLPKEALYWIIKSKVYAHFKEVDLEKDALLRAASLSPNNNQIKLELLWFFMASNDIQNLKPILMEMTENDLDSSYYLPLASAYFYLNDINRASYYTQSLLYEENPVINLIEFKFLQAYIYQIRNNQPAFKTSMEDIVSDLKKDAKKNPKLKKSNKYLSNYLRAAMYTQRPDKFEKKLKKAKPYLSDKNYDEISYSWAIKNRAEDKSLKIYHRMNKRDYKKELWVEFSNAIVFQEHTNMENILGLYLASIAMGDAAQSSHKDGQTALAQTITFEGLRHNDDNQNVYIKHLELSRERTDQLGVKASYYNREPLLQKFVEIDNRTYLQDGYYLHAGFDYYANSTQDDKVLVTVPSSTLEALVGIQRMYNRGYLAVDIAYHSSMESYMSASINGEYMPTTDLLLGAELSKNIDAYEGTQLLLGGRKDMLALELSWRFFNATILEVLYEHNEYESQDNVYLGSGDFSRIGLYQQIRNGYPDLRVGTYYDFATYQETDGTRGVIDELQAERFRVIPSNFYNIGINIAYGMANSSAYTRVWRPYAEFSPYYSEELDDFSYGFNIGYGGKVWHQDHLIIGASYTDSVNGIGGSILELFLKYEFMYYHP